MAKMISTFLDKDISALSYNPTQEESMKEVANILVEADDENLT
jgi:hypothetical protein